MEKYAILLGYYEKQWPIIQKLEKQITGIDLSVYESRYVFALKTQQFYTAIEDLLKQTAKSFENHIEDLSMFHKELLVRLHTPIPSIRPQLLSEESFLLLDKVRAFLHFIRHAYDCELLENELKIIQDKLKIQFTCLEKDFSEFRHFVKKLS
ncbi:MAG: hypothetical protein K2Y01_02615 [Rhabdochlamydiaceae bacterium]|nr:hypothetical protein [Rhabdochlamydiaceae bacterium]